MNDGRNTWDARCIEGLELERSRRRMTKLDWMLDFRISVLIGKVHSSRRLQKVPDGPEAAGRKLPLGTLGTLDVNHGL